MLRTCRSSNRCARSSSASRDPFKAGRCVYNGVLYATSAFATFAVDAATCELIWSYRHDPGQAFRANNKGAAIADGRIIRGLPDGHLIALDAKTGALLWDRFIMDSTAGELVTAAPLVWKGMIFLGKAGGDMGIRGEMMAFRATDGEKIWGFNTIPGPGETGSDTWQNPASIAHGGGGTWTSYSLDTTAGLLLVPVGTPVPISPVRRGRAPTCSPIRSWRSMRRRENCNGGINCSGRKIATGTLPSSRPSMRGIAAGSWPSPAKTASCTSSIAQMASFGSPRRSFRATSIERRRSRRTLPFAYALSRRCNGTGQHTAPTRISST